MKIYFNSKEDMHYEKQKPKKFKNFTEEEVQHKKKANKKDYSKERQVKTRDYSNE